MKYIDMRPSPLEETNHPYDAMDDALTAIGQLFGFGAVLALVCAVGFFLFGRCL